MRTAKPHWCWCKLATFTITASCVNGSLPWAIEWTRILRAHRAWGRRDSRVAVNELNGMFAYALWDTAQRELLLIREGLGIKPLFYYLTAGGVLFGSESRRSWPMISLNGPWTRTDFVAPYVPSPIRTIRSSAACAKYAPAISSG